MQEYIRGFYFLPISWGTWLREVTGFYSWVLGKHRAKELLRTMR